MNTPLAIAPSKPKNQPWRAFIIVLLAIALFGGGAFAYYYFYGPCGTLKVAEAGKNIQDILNRWTDAEKIASSTSRISLAGPVADMQKIRREANGLQVPACMETTKNHLLLVMDNALNGYFAFMQQESNSIVSTYFDTARNYANQVTEDITTVSKCKPFCAP